MNEEPLELTEENKEEVDYVNAAGCTLDKTAATSGRRFLSFAQSFAPMTVCWLILLVIMALRIYFTSVMSENIAKLTAERDQTFLLGFSHNLTNLNHKLSSENETLRRDHDNLMGQLDKLTQAHTASQGQITNLRTENQQLKTHKQKLERQKQELKTQNQHLETDNQQLKTHKQELERYNQQELKRQNQELEIQNQELKRQNQELKRQYQQLKTHQQELEGKNQQMETENQKLKTQYQQLKTHQQELERYNQQLKTRNHEMETERNAFIKTIEDLETKRNELVVHRTQWIIDAYCPKKDGVVSERQCEPCQRGWTFFQSSCYDIHYVEWRSWDVAQTSCKRQNSDLVVVVNEQEKTFISNKSLDSSETRGYWIGLRVEDGRWKWVDGSDLTESSWTQPPADGHCAISVRNAGWRSVNCATTNYWICKQKALD